jgi:hypothetical protein
MTEGQKAHYKVSMRNALRRAHLASCPKVRADHLAAADEFARLLSGQRIGAIVEAVEEPLRLAA